MGRDNLHVVVIPWSAFGHIMPLFQFSQAIAKAGVKVSFLSTPTIVKRLPKISPDLTHLIDLVPIPLPRFEGDVSLPPGAEATVDLPFDKIEHLKIAFDLLKYPVSKFVSRHSPDWIITDEMACWAADVAQEHDVPLMGFSPFSVAASLYFGPPEYLVGDGRVRVRSTPESMTGPPPWAADVLPATIGYKGGAAIGVLNGFYGTFESGISVAERLAKSRRAYKALAIRSCDEFEGKHIDRYHELLGVPVIPVGLLPPAQDDEKIPPDGPWRETFDWLDTQKPKSVVFVGFGSECKLTKEQIHELAHGLELSGLPFLWALRKPTWAIDELDALPQGFGPRTAGLGQVVMGWAPQMRILGHLSVGGSLFHCGWGSMIETLQFGHSLVVLPLIVDQPLNAALVAAREMAVEVERNGDGSFGRDGVSKALRLAMVDEEGEKYRKNAREAAKVFGNHELHENYVAKLVEFLKEPRVKGGLMFSPKS